MVRVLLVEGATMMRWAMQRHLAADPEIDVVAGVQGVSAARALVRRLRPDVLVLDLGPEGVDGADGLPFLKEIMQHDPLPVIIMTEEPPASSRRAMAALGLGAVDVFNKPASAERSSESLATLTRQIKAAAGARAETPRADRGGAAPAAPMTSAAPTAPAAPMTPAAPTAPAAPAAPAAPEPTRFPAWRVIAIGASTGGTRAIEAILRQFPANAPGTLVVQHMPAYFTRTFAEGLDRACAAHVKEAEHGDVLTAGRVLVAPGDHHMVLIKSGTAYHVELTKGPREHFQRPSVDVTFRSVARAAGRNATGILLTGMGSDGATGLLEMLHAGAWTIAQDQATSVVFGMPAEAIRLGAAKQVLPLDRIAGAALLLASRVRGAA